MVKTKLFLRELYLVDFNLKAVHYSSAATMSGLIISAKDLTILAVETVQENEKIIWWFLGYHSNP